MRLSVCWACRRETVPATSLITASKAMPQGDESTLPGHTRNISSDSLALCLAERICVWWHGANAVCHCLVDPFRAGLEFIQIGADLPLAAGIRKRVAYGAGRCGRLREHFLAGVGVIGCCGHAQAEEQARGRKSGRAAKVVRFFAARH